MNIPNWSYTVKDIATYPDSVKIKSESVLANSVNAANFDLSKLLNPIDRVLEIGCGASSYLKDHMENEKNWDGIDVYAKDSRDRQCIATRLGSVHAIPFENDLFDIVLSNQSIEHWFEYGVTLNQGLADIIRVLKIGGKAYINFPFFLHGHPYFVQGDLESILSCTGIYGVELVDVVAYKDSNEENYLGWRRCGFPDFYVNNKNNAHTSYVVELVLRKISNANDKRPEKPDEQKLDLQPRLSKFRRALPHGFSVLAWKVFQKVLGR